MIAEPLALSDVLLVKPQVFRDGRGHFLETWRDVDYRSLGIGPFVQDNVSLSRRGVLRGLHLQHPSGQSKLIYAIRGRVFDVAVDVRTGSPTFGKWAGVELSAELGWQLYLPIGFAHGFLALTDEAIVGYKCSSYYAPESERVIRWDDPAIGIDWPVPNPALAPKDEAAPLLSELPPGSLPCYQS